MLNKKNNKRAVSIIELNETEKERVQNFEKAKYTRYSETIAKVISFFALFCGYFIT